MSSTEVDGEAGGIPPAQESTVPSKRSRMHRLAPLVLVAGAAIAAMSLAPHLPRERYIELRFDHPSSITAVNVDWTATLKPRAASPDRVDEALQGASWRFAAGAAPRSLVTKVRLPDGAYEMDIRIDRVDRVESVQRSIKLDGADRIAVSVR